MVTGQVELDSYADTGVLVATALVNALARAVPGAASDAAVDHAALVEILAVDPPSLTQLERRHLSGFRTLAQRLREVFEVLRRGDIDAAAARLNELLARCPAQPHLAKEHGVWRLHHHPANASLIPMWTAICAEALARLIGAGHAGRLGTCARADCERAFVDVSRNASRRFCSTTCQNRVKVASFRSRNKRRERR
jgi:predicted RNA-binding Zn ribbon-like protein